MRRRPVDITKPGPGQESVWDYPRPPRLEVVTQPVRVELAGHVVAESTSAVRILETASPPTYYLPPADVDATACEPSPRRSFCEWKGEAHYWNLRVLDRFSGDAAWSYPVPSHPFEALRGFLAFYPGRVDACWVGSLRVTPQPGSFYGGWITPNLTGPFKGEPGTGYW